MSLICIKLPYYASLLAAISIGPALLKAANASAQNLLALDQEVEAELPARIHRADRDFLPELKYFYDHDRLYYQLRWSEHALAVLNLPTEEHKLYRWQYRLHFPVWKLLSIAPGFDVSYFQVQEKMSRYLNPANHEYESLTMSGHNLAAALGFKLQAGFGKGSLTVAPFLDFGADLLARSWLYNKNHPDFKDGRLEAGYRQQRSAGGLNMYLDIGSISLGLGLERGLLFGDLGGRLNYQGFQIIIRSP